MNGKNGATRQLDRNLPILEDIIRLDLVIPH